MYFTREALTAPEEFEASRNGGSATATSEQATEYDPGVVRRVFNGAPGEPPGNAATTLLRSPALSSRSNTGVRVIALSRAQQTHGNRYTQRLVSQIQLSSNRSLVVQRQCACGGTCSTCSSPTSESAATVTSEETGIVQRQTSGSAGSNNGSGSNGNGSNGGSVIPRDSYGQPLDEATQRLMETRFGANFQDVRVHTDQSAAASAEALEANAYTTGRDIYFGAGKYAPASQEGQHLLAHELTHVQQQAAGQTPLEAEGATDGHVIIGSANDRLEVEADRQADSVTSGGQVTDSVTPDSSGAIQLDGWNSFGDNPITNTVTSGARQGADLVATGARQGVDLVVSGAKQGVAYIMAQIEKYAPGAIAFFRNIRDYFKDAISKGVDGVFGGIISRIKEKGLAATLAEMIGAFASGAFQAVSGFVAGHCAAMGKLAEYLIDIHIRIGSGILDQLKKGFDAIRGPLEELWTEYGAKAIDWIKKKLKGMWQGVEDTASTIWKALKPLREGAAWVWEQVTDFLVDSRRGFNDWLEWIIPKAIDEWEKVKAKLKPYMGYVKTAAKIIAAVVLLFSPAGPFIAAGLAIYGLYLGVKELWDKWGRGFTRDVRDWLANKALPWVQGKLQGIRDIVKSIKNSVVGVIQSLYDVFMQVLDALGVITFLESVKSAFNSVAKKVKEFKEKLDQKLEQWSEKLQALMTKADPYLQQLKEAFRQSLLIGAFGPYAFLDDGVWNSMNKFVALLMRTPCLRELGGLLRVPSHMQRLGRLRAGIKEGWEVIKNPDPLLAKMKEAVAPMVGKIEPEVHQRVATIGSGGTPPAPNAVASRTPGPTAAITATPPTPAIANAQRGPATPTVPRTPAEIEAEKERSEYDERRRQAAAMSATGPMTEREIFIQLSVWHYLSASLVHLASNWWEELKKIGGELLWPWPAVARDFVPMIEDFSNAVSVAFDLEFSDAIDKFLAGMRKFNGIAGALSGWFLIASVLIGAALGALGFAFGPAGVATVGAGASAGLAFAEEVGMGLLVIALATEAAVLEKAQFDLLYQNPRMAEAQRYTADQEDAKAIAGSLMSVITIGALFLLADIAARFAKFFWSMIENIPIVSDIASLLRDAKKAAGDFTLKEKPGAVEPPRETGAPRDVTGEPTRAPEPGERPVEPGERPVEPGERPAERPSERLTEDAAAKAEKQGVPSERLQAEVGELNRKASNPDNVGTPENTRFDAEMNTDVHGERHSFDRNKSDRTWCRFTDPACGLDLGGELNSKVDTALKEKPTEAPKIGDERPVTEPTPAEGAREPAGRTDVPEGQQRAPSGGVFEWPPRPPEGPKPAIDAPTGAEWRYREYRHKKYTENPSIREAEIPPFPEYQRRYIDPALEGGRPGRAGSKAHQDDVNRTLNDNPGSGPTAVGNRVPDVVGQPGKSMKIRGETIVPEGQGRVIVEADIVVFEGRIPNSEARAQVRDMRAADPDATLVVTDYNNPNGRPLVYPPRTQPPRPGPLGPNPPVSVPFPD